MPGSQTEETDMNWMFFIGLFAKPLGAMINNALSAGSAAVIAYGASKGFDSGMTTPIVSAVVLGLSQTISALASTQGVTIPIINADTTNGVKVVAANSPAPAVNAPIPAPAGSRD